MCGASTQSEYSMKHLYIANNKPSEFCITSQEYKCSHALSYLSFHHDIRDNPFAFVEQ